MFDEEAPDFVIKDLEDASLGYYEEDPPTIILNDIRRLIEENICNFLAHEHIHHILQRLEGNTTSEDFDNIFGGHYSECLTTGDFTPFWWLIKLSELRRGKKRRKES